jgi:Right handed beta helix region
VSLPLISTRSLESPASRQRVAESINDILTFRADDWRTRTKAEQAAGVYPINSAYIPGDLMRYGAKGDGTTVDTDAINQAISTGHDIFVREGTTFLTNGGHTISTDGLRVYGGGGFKKLAGTVQPIFTLADEVESVSFEDVQFDGTRASFSSGNAVPAVLGYIARNPTFLRCKFRNIIDVGVKMRDCGGVVVIGCLFENVDQNGVELRNYVNDPRTGSAYVNARPVVEGNHKVTGCTFRRIDDGNSGAGDGCGVTFDSVNSSYPHINVVVANNTFEDVLRSIWSENNTSGTEALGVSITGNTIRGNVAGSGTVETKDGIGLIGVKGAIVSNNAIINVGNFAPSGGNCSGIQISGSSGDTASEDVLITNNVIIDNTGNTDRTDYCINVALGNRIKVLDNITRGASINQIIVSSANVTELEIRGNYGAESEYSWGQVIPLIFYRDDIPANTTSSTYPYNNTNDTELVIPSTGRLVGISVKLSTAITAGTISVDPYTNGTLRTGLQIVNADFGGGTVATKTIDVDDGVTISAGQRFRVDIVTNATFAPTTADAQITLFIDISTKE